MLLLHSIKGVELEFNIIKKLNKKQRKKLYKLYKKEWWTKDREKKDIKKMLKNSDIIIGITDENRKLIAFARVLSDYIYKAEIYDVIVDTKYRHLGVGKLIMDNIINHKKLKKVKQFNLQCKKEMIPFYEKWGFKDTLELIYMRFVRD